MPAPNIESIYPADGAVGVPVGAPLLITFSDEIDLTSIKGNLIITGASLQQWTGPDMVLFDRPDTEPTENILTSPSFKGIVPGTATVEYLDSMGVVVDVEDFSGLGSGNTTYKHRVIFTPNNILSPNTVYTVYISGDESGLDDVVAGVSSRTVFDAEPDPGNVGDGELIASGGYSGLIDDVFHFTITVGGGFGVAKYEWYKDSDSLMLRTGFTSKQSSTLVESNGLTIKWAGLSSTPFTVGDEFSVQVRAPIYMTDSYSWTFTTGSGNIQALPTTTSTTTIGGLGIDVGLPLIVLSVDPDIRSTNTSLSTRVIKITFNKPILASSVLDRLISIEALSVNGDPSIPSLGFIGKIIRVEGSVVYCILQSGLDAA